MRNCCSESFGRHALDSSRPTLKHRGDENTIRRGLAWKRFGVIFSLLIIIFAGFTLYHLFRNIDVSKIVAALRAQPPRNILIAFGFVIAGYITLIFYEVFALRTIGCRAVPFRAAAVASFISFAIGHSLGAATFTGGLVRLRIYSNFGLNAFDIAKISFLTGMTFVLGAALVLGGAISWVPDAASAVDRLPTCINRTIGLSTLFGIITYLIWLGLRPRIFGRADWQIRLPGPRATLLQLGIGATDLLLVTSAMYSLLPPAPPIQLATVVVIFVLALLLGAISHAPGSLGVIEAAMLIGQRQFPEEELLAALLTFRVLYFLLPLLLATAILVLRELGFVAQPGRVDPEPCSRS